MDMEKVVELMKSSRSPEEWNENCDKVKEFYGQYPDFWYPAIIISGVCAETQAGW